MEGIKANLRSRLLNLDVIQLCNLHTKHTA
jgi:hypothetical protein